MLQSDQSAVRRGGKMSEKPILFSGAMVRAILEGGKSQTRRVVKNARGANSLYAGEHDGLWVVERFGDAASTMIKCPYGKPGDILYVREAVRLCGADDVGAPLAQPPVWYKADGECDVRLYPHPRSSMFMPRWASRITLEIVEVRVQRLQDISEEDARAEGVGPLRADGRMLYGAYPASDEFADLWDSINMKRGFGWNVNPFVWVIAFKRVTP
jgi:hypothetical protein